MNMNEQTKPQRGIWLSSILVLLSIVFPLQLVVGILGFFLTSLFGGGILESTLYLLTGVLGLYATILLWRFKMLGYYLFLGSVASSLLSYYVAFGEISMISLAIYACWVLILSLNLKKFK
ncbi:hypothetical protein N9M15_04380 [Bacteroidia bacterium]|nr:hypothetical protein [Bacteroidia bacterium]